ncbi:GUN4 domain-containing protein [Crocosphaera sp. UHCC 0190]|uniref:GUN4 domain-containing protein n=1 Tax=Crocosphaera sp. UHCC 0190 TaxID=3110246 RepID=UPI002B1F8D3D|nr:GUN4 domain-containing protein [Crocosphaera sp. UHCC 0190]MEA5509665.1 GUN4 domain-containing protein [Crocosphaera sp. UHCC 0190]
MTELDSKIDFNEPSQKELELTKRITQLEQRLEKVLLLLPDVYRYEKLQELLAAGNFKEADQETMKVMLEVEGKASQDDLTPGDLKTYPSHVLKVIDRLWCSYSNEHFGFSIQLKIYQEVGGTPQSVMEGSFKVLSEAAFKFGWKDDPKKLGLKDYDTMNFSLSAPQGQLPMQWWVSPYGTKLANFFLARLMECDF